MQHGKKIKNVHVVYGSETFDGFVKTWGGSGLIPDVTLAKHDDSGPHYHAIDFGRATLIEIEYVDGRTETFPGREQLQVRFRGTPIDAESTRRQHEKPKFTETVGAQGHVAWSKNHDVGRFTVYVDGALPADLKVAERSEPLRVRQSAIPLRNAVFAATVSVAGLRHLLPPY